LVSIEEEREGRESGYVCFAGHLALFSTWIFNCTDVVVVVATIVGLLLFVVRFTG
jgi:hypothetical protein